MSHETPTWPHRPMTLMELRTAISLKVSPLFLGIPKQLSDMCPQRSLSATATVRCVLLAQEPLEKASLLCCSLLDVGVHPGATSPSFCSCQAFRQRLGDFVAQNHKRLPRKNSDFGSLSFQFCIFRLRPRGHVTNAMNQPLLSVMCLALLHKLGIQE